MEGEFASLFFLACVVCVLCMHISGEWERGRERGVRARGPPRGCFVPCVLTRSVAGRPVPGHFFLFLCVWSHSPHARKKRCAVCTDAREPRIVRSLPGPHSSGSVAGGPSHLCGRGPAGNRPSACAAAQPHAGARAWLSSNAPRPRPGSPRHPTLPQTPLQKSACVASMCNLCGCMRAPPPHPGPPIALLPFHKIRRAPVARRPPPPPPDTRPDSLCPMQARLACALQLAVLAMLAMGESRGREGGEGRGAR